MKKKKQEKAGFKGFTLEEMSVSCSTCMGKEDEIMKKKNRKKLDSRALSLKR